MIRQYTGGEKRNTAEDDNETGKNNKRKKVEEGHMVVKKEALKPVDEKKKGFLYDKPAAANSDSVSRQKIQSNIVTVPISHIIISMDIFKEGVENTKRP